MRFLLVCETFTVLRDCHWHVKLILISNIVVGACDYSWQERMFRLRLLLAQVICPWLKIDAITKKSLCSISLRPDLVGSGRGQTAGGSGGGRVCISPHVLAGQGYHAGRRVH